MTYEKQTWETGDIITKGKLNHIEDGIETAHQSQPTDDKIYIRLDTTEHFLEDIKIFYYESGGRKSDSDIRDIINNGVYCKLLYNHTLVPTAFRVQYLGGYMGSLMRLQVVEFSGLNENRTSLDFVNYELNLDQVDRLNSTWSTKPTKILTNNGMLFVQFTSYDGMQFDANASRDTILAAIDNDIPVFAVVKYKENNFLTIGGTAGIGFYQEVLSADFGSYTLINTGGSQYPNRWNLSSTNK